MRVQRSAGSRLTLVLALLATSACRPTPTGPPARRPTLPGAWSENLPSVVSSLESGRLIFASRCSECHGALGAGDGPAAALLRTPPPDMSDPHYMAAQRPEYYAEAIRVGVPGTGMPRWDHVLDERAVWDAAFYAWSLGAPEGAAQRGKEAYASQCGRCHASDGMGVAVAPLGGPEFAARTRAEVTEAIVRAHPDLARGLSRAQLADLTEGLFGFLFSDAAGR